MLYKNMFKLCSKSIYTIGLRRLLYKNYIRSFSTNFSVNNPPVVKYLEFVKQEYWSLYTNENLDVNGKKRLDELLPIVKVLEERECVEGNLKSLEDMNSKDQKDDDMRELIAEERQVPIAI